MPRVKQSNPKRTPAMFQRTQVIRNPYHKRNLRRTTRKGAYSKNTKKAFQIRRAPFVETKVNSPDAMTKELQMEAEESTGGLWNSMVVNTQVHNSDAHTLLPIAPWIFTTQGTDDHNMLGRSIFSKYLKTKVEFTLPSQDRVIRHPAEVYLIHGWVTQPTGATAHTVPSDKNMTYAEFNNHVNDQIKQWFNDRYDKLRFIEKTQSNLKILGYQKLRVKPKSNLGMDPQIFESGLNDKIVGAPPTINMTCTWPCMKKLHMTKGQKFTAYSGHETDFYYPNHSWIPFLMVYSPTYESFRDTDIYPDLSTDEPIINVRYNTQHYFTDS